MEPALRERIVATTVALMAFESTADRPDQLAAVLDYVDDQLTGQAGLHRRRYERNGAPSLMVTLHDTQAPAIILNAHLDVVPARAEQFRASVRQGRIYGRGSQDMKGSAAVYLHLLQACATLASPPDIGVQFVTDEEIGGLDGTRLLLEAGWRCGLFVAGEPTDLQICHAQKGMMRLDVIIPGAPAHGSRPWAGRNPIAGLRDGLVALERRFPTPREAAWQTTVVPTIVTGGNAENRLPERVRLRLDIRHIAADTPAAIIAGVRDAFPGAEVLGAPIAGGLLDTDPAHPMLAPLTAAITGVTGQPTRFVREHYGSDARFYSDAGIPAVCFGPVGDGLHSDDEWVDIDSLMQFFAITRRHVLHTTSEES
ncbi:MAG: M20 family metallopeptidase [Chloroflexi bacterium]|nr:M20 family metallopeptidase [Chloroflexota bacterium]